MYDQRFRNKYNAKKTNLNGKTYDSKFEGSVALDLEVRKQVGEITHFDTHVPLELRIDGKLWRTWKIDFIAYLPNGSREFIEAKGMWLGDAKAKFDFFEIVFDRDFRQHTEDKIILIRQGRNFDWLKPKKNNEKHYKKTR